MMIFMVLLDNSLIYGLALGSPELINHTKDIQKAPVSLRRLFEDSK